MLAHSKLMSINELGGKVLEGAPKTQPEVLAPVFTSCPPWDFS